MKPTPWKTVRAQIVKPEDEAAIAEARAEMKALARDEQIKIDLDPETALRGLFKVNLEAERVDEDPSPPHGDHLPAARDASQALRR